MYYHVVFLYYFNDEAINVEYDERNVRFSEREIKLRIERVAFRVALLFSNENRYT